MKLLRPVWAAPARVQARVSTRGGGVSVGPYGESGSAAHGLNLAMHVGDDGAAVLENRRRLSACLPGPVHWLDQVHETTVHEPDRLVTVSPGPGPVRADAAVTSQPGQVLAVLTADCLPVFFADTRGECVGVAHAGWRGLAAGVLEQTVAAMRARVGDRLLVAWIGPGIGPRAYEVGEEVREAFCGNDPAAHLGFTRATGAGKWMADLPALAARRLARLGIDQVQASGDCTLARPDLYYSHRRDRVTGRFASLIWIGG